MCATSLGAPDVLAVQEVENLVALQDVANRIHADDPTLAYAAHLMEGNDIGGIDVGFLVRDTVRVDSIEQFGKDTIFTFPGAHRRAAQRSAAARPARRIRRRRRGVPDHRHQRAPAVVERHRRPPTAPASGPSVMRRRCSSRSSSIRCRMPNPGIHLVAIGDFNAFEFTDGYVDVMGQVTGKPDPAGALLPATDEISQDLTNQTFNMPADQRYSFVFDGTAQSLDHAITSQALDAFIRGAQHARGNADAPFAFADRRHDAAAVVGPRRDRAVRDGRPRRRRRARQPRRLRRYQDSGGRADDPVEPESLRTRGRRRNVRYHRSAGTNVSGCRRSPSPTRPAARASRSSTAIGNTRSRRAEFVGCSVGTMRGAAR